MLGRLFSSSGFVGVDVGSTGIKMIQVREMSARARRHHDAGAAFEVVGSAFVPNPLTQSAVAPANTSADPRPGSATTLTPPVVDPSSYPDNTATTVRGASSAASLAHHTNEELTQRIRVAFASGGFTGRRCAIALPREDVFIQSVRLPRMSDEELAQTAGWEAAQRFGIDRNAMQFDYIRTGAAPSTGETREEIVLIAASHAAIHSHVEPLLQAGLQPIAVETGFSALARWCSRRTRRESDQNVVRAVIDIGASGSTVMILRGDQIAFCKTLAICGRMFDRAVAEHLQLSVPEACELRRQRMAGARRDFNAVTQDASRVSAQMDSNSTVGVHGTPQFTPGSSTDRAMFAAVRPIMNDLAREITLCLRYFGVTFRGNAPARILLVGGESLEPHLDEVIGKHCALPTEVDGTADVMGMPTIGMTSWATALGLSIRKLDRSPSDTEGGQTPLGRHQSAPASHQSPRNQTAAPVSAMGASRGGAA